LAVRKRKARVELGQTEESLRSRLGQGLTAENFLAERFFLAAKDPSSLLSPGELHFSAKKRKPSATSCVAASALYHIFDFMILGRRKKQKTHDEEGRLCGFVGKA
jgi:hypothetical protein